MKEPLSRSQMYSGAEGSGVPEGQDSQAIIEAFRAEFGVGTLSNSPRPEQQNESILPVQVDGKAEFGKGRPGAETRLVEDQQFSPPITTNDHSRNFTKQLFVDADADIGAARVPVGDAQSESSLPREHSNSLVSQVNASRWPAGDTERLPRLANSLSGPSRKMDGSQQTPTQPNTDRDYETFCDTLISSQDGANHDVDGLAAVHNTNDRTLQEDDTGAVNFGDLSDLGRPSSQVSEDAGFENTRGEWRNQDRASQQFSGRGYTPHKPGDPAPETPALPKNPFGTTAGIGVPMGGTQLFGQTQFSSTMKKISPTSSRPSPNLYQDYMSANALETSPLKDRANVSSPTDIRTSSPQRLHEVPATTVRTKDSGLERIVEETPSHNKSTDEDLVPESPTMSPRRPRSSDREPLSHYEPMMKSQERKLTGDAPLSDPASDGSDSDDMMRKMERRKRIEKKKAQAAVEMGKVHFTPLSRRSSNEQPRWKRRRIASEDEENTSSAPGHEGVKTFETPSVVRDSQRRFTGSAETPPVASNKIIAPDQLPEIAGLQNGAEASSTDALKPTDEEMIPATSPAGSMPIQVPDPSNDRRTASLPDLHGMVDHMAEAEKLDQADEMPDQSSSLPPRNRRTRMTYGARKKNKPFVSSSVSTATSNDNALAEEQIDQHDEEAISTEQDETPRMRTRKTSPRVPASTAVATRSGTTGRSPLTPQKHEDAATTTATSSSLTVLSTTPVQSSKTTPGTQNTTSPRLTRSAERTRSRMTASSESPRPATRFLRTSRRSTIVDFESTEELPRSSSASALEHSMAPNKAGRSSRYALMSNQRGSHLFSGMTFAISFQSSQTKQGERTKLENKISQAGGLILEEGFRELFEHSTVLTTTQPLFDQSDCLRLTRPGLDSGFTALLADEHSRKAKYMQALALGLPCLAPQWITTCLTKGAIVDWEPYLLCAGPSAVLGNAIRSRSLVPYAAADARLSDVIEHRPGFLKGQTLLVVVDAKKSRSEAKQPYIFLAHALGPSVSRVFSIQQARKVLRERDRAGEPFDWVYVDKGTGSVDAVFAPPQEETSRKRKRAGPAPQPLSPSTRILDDELVIQSLILGRMVEESEICF